MASVFEHFQLDFSSLIALGQWVEGSPVVAIGSVLVLLVALFVLKKLLGLIKAVIMVVLAVILIGIFIHYTEPWLGWLWGANEAVSHPTLEYFDQSEWERRGELVHKAPGTDDEGLVKSILFRGKAEAPDLSDMTFLEGVQLLAEVAQEHPGEVGYLYYVLDDGTEHWTDGTYSEEAFLRLPSINVVLVEHATEDIEYIAMAHTHPTIVEGDWHPPSGTDFIAHFTTVEVYPEVLDLPIPDMIAVQESWYWVQEYEDRTLYQMSEAEVGSFDRELLRLDKIYNCKFHERQDATACSGVGVADRLDAAKAYISHIEAHGFDITQHQLTERPSHIPLAQPATDNQLFDRQDI